MHPWSGMYGWPWPAVLWIIAFLLFWGGLLALLIWALRQSAGSRRESAEDILRRRLANGDITQEEYERIRNILRE
jgi:putative membrane protein